MIHISKLALQRVMNVEDIVKVGDSVEIEVIEINKEKGRIGLKRIISAEEQARYEEQKKTMEAKKAAEMNAPKVEVKIDVDGEKI